MSDARGQLLSLRCGFEGVSAIKGLRDPVAVVSLDPPIRHISLPIVPGVSCLMNEVVLTEWRSARVSTLQMDEVSVNSRALDEY